ncbi:C-type lectin domain family 4 member M-like [Pecten maximus]|uniref:C-type lectin domain family 4 member M-like n=1 Tax=Pecten maximus TaxID=6579 RepID=UPI0014587F0F|nr:C-type lectin domain family 4 member M-like [Pecten maximus]
MIGHISQTQRVVSRGHCAMLCEAEEMCYMFEYEDITSKCNVFNGFQQHIGNETFPNGPRTVYKDKDRCARTSYTLVRDGLMCYKVYEEQKTWNDAYLACQNDGGRLFVIQNFMQIEYLLTYDADSLAKRFAWIGLTDQKLEGEWIYVDGTSFNESIWPFVRFNNKCSRYQLNQDEADCAHLNVNKRYIYDCHCNVSKPYICEHPQLV